MCFFYKPPHRIASLKMVRLLLENGANFNRRDINGNSPFTSFIENNLHCSRAAEAAFNLFLEYGANMDSRGRHGATPLLMVFRSSSFHRNQWMWHILKHRPNAVCIALIDIN